jgi:Arc/MetJ-type ribon-helix-helix transcriptional regulator
MLPPDDLYARLELPVDASFEAVEIAWRALLKRHHPDIAGPAAVETAKRINVAHDWLSDPVLRARYDRERVVTTRRRGIREGAGPRAAAGRGADRRPVPARPPRPLDPAQAFARHLERIARLTPDELDRLTLAETQPIAFVASISRFLPRERLDVLETVEDRIQAALPRRARWDAPTRDAAIGYAYELLLGPFLDEHLSEPFRERIRERLARGWEAAVDQPRYGPNSEAVRAALERLERLTPAERGLLASSAVAGAGGTDFPWPRGLSPTDDDGLRVSSALAQRDAIALLPEPMPAIARRSLARAMHGLVLRHGFKPAELERLSGPWASVVLPAAAAPAGARRR